MIFYAVIAQRAINRASCAEMLFVRRRLGDLS